MHLTAKLFHQASYVLTTVLFLHQAVLGQSLSLSGVVVNASTEEPLAFANVFISNTTRGTTTALNGAFQLQGIPAGRVDLVVSYVGYKPQTFSFDLDESTTLTEPIRLQGEKRELLEIEVTARKDRKWERRKERFENIFLGNSDFALQCSIINPWVLEFSEDKEGKEGFSATAHLPLEIKNEALGYRIFYHLKLFTANAKSFFFTGSARFEELEESTPEQRDLWIRNRTIAYLGSPRHLFQAILFNNILEGQLMEERFMLYKDKSGFENYAVRSPLFSKENGVTLEPVITEGLVTPSYRTGLYRILLSGRVEVHYSRNFGKPQNVIYNDLPFEVSWLEIQSNFVDVTKEGIHQRPDQVIVSGAMLEGRVAKMLPHDFVPAHHKY